MKDPYVRRALAFTVPTVFVLVLLGTAFRDRTLDPTVAGGLIAILGSVVALFAAQNASQEKSPPTSYGDTPDSENPLEVDIERQGKQEKN